MTNEDAIKLLKWILAEGKECEDLEYHGVSVKEAIEMAVKALQENEKLKAQVKKWRLKAEEITRLWNEEGEEKE